MKIPEGSPNLVTRPGDLIDACRRLAAAGSFAIDMEFESERSYWPRLHLIQVATFDEALLIDPQAFRDLSPLFDLIVDPKIRKITHAGRQDAEIVFHQAGRPPENWFDTQIAAALLGMGDQVGYANLAGRLVGARIAKIERVTDWSIRPLSPAQTRYALDDVLYLPEMGRLLAADLERLGRTVWLEEELAFYRDPGTFRRDPEHAWLRVSGRGTLDRRGLGILRELAAWREEDAARRDEPRGRIVSDAVLVEIAARRPKAPHELKPLRRLHHRELERSGEALVAAVARGLALPDSELPVLHRTPPDDPELGLAVHLLDVLVRVRAREHRIAASYLANQQSIRELVEHLDSPSEDGSGPVLLDGWRRELIGDELVSLFRGKLALRMDPASRHPVAIGQETAHESEAS